MGIPLKSLKKDRSPFKSLKKDRNPLNKGLKQCKHPLNKGLKNRPYQSKGVWISMEMPQQPLRPNAAIHLRIPGEGGDA